MVLNLASPRHAAHLSSDVSLDVVKRNENFNVTEMDGDTFPKCEKAIVRIFTHYQTLKNFKYSVKAPSNFSTETIAQRFW